MKIVKMDDENVVIFLPNFSLDFSNKKDLEKYFKELFLKLEDQYDMTMRGFYQIKIYQDRYYGAIFEINKEDIPYFDYLEEQIEMSIQIMKHTFFLYQVEDILEFKKISSFLSIYYYQDHFFIEIKEKLSPNIYWKLLEHSHLMYGSIVQNIVKFGNRIDFRLCK